MVIEGCRAGGPVRKGKLEKKETVELTGKSIMRLRNDHSQSPASDCVTDDYDFSTKISLDTIQGLVDSIFQAGLLGSFSLNESTVSCTS